MFLAATGQAVSRPTGHKSPMANRLQDRIALVTGAARGLGAQIARTMAEEGARVIGSDINIAGLDDSALTAAIELDVSREADWQAAADRIAADYGRLDILVNNAGIEDVGAIGDITIERWRRLMSINLDGVFLGCRTMLALLRAGGARGERASIVNISSVAGLIGIPNQVSYNSSKAGVAHLTKSLAVEFARGGTPIRVNSIHPGCILTPMLEEVMDDWIEKGLISEEQRISAIAGLCPLNEIGDPKDIAYGAVYLASAEARFVTGIELAIDGGWTAA